MNLRDLRALVFAGAVVVLLLVCCPYVIPQKSFNENISLSEPEILSGANGWIIPYGYDEVYGPDVDYHFDGHNYTTGTLRDGFIYPSRILKDGECHLFFCTPMVVDRYFGDARFLSFQFYADQPIMNGWYHFISSVKGVCNGDVFYYKTDTSKDIFYGKFGYKASCELLPNKAVITYYPDKTGITIAGGIITLILTLLYLVVDIRLFPGE